MTRRAHGRLAELAGIRPGDVITKIGGHRIEAAADVRAAVSEQRIGGSTTVKFVRSGERRTVELRIAELTSEEPPGGAKD